MKPISLTVNGGKYEVLVEPRTQLAEVLRDKLHLTGTQPMPARAMARSWRQWRVFPATRS